MPSLTWWHHFACLTTLKLCLGQNSTKPNICICGFTGIVVRCFRPHLNLTRLVVLLCFTLLPCLTTFNIVGYINKIELNKSRGVSSICNGAPLNLQCCLCILPCHASLNRTCIMLDCASCHDYVMVVYYVVCFFPVFLLWVSSVNVAFVRIRWLCPFIFFMDSFLLPCGISGKMTIPSKSLLSLLARCSLLSNAYVVIPTTLLIMPPILLNQASNPPCPSKPLFGYVTALLSPSYSVASCR